MREHIAQVHEGKKREKKRTRNLKCSSCGYKSETRRGMLKHITLQHEGQNVQIINVAPKKALFEKAKEDHKKCDNEHSKHVRRAFQGVPYHS